LDIRAAETPVCLTIKVMDKEIRWSDHAKLKLNILNQRNLEISPKRVIETIRSPDATFIEDDDTIIAQANLDENLVLRIVYREFNALIFIITLYPGKRSRYEKAALQ
jgi:hypothetical protein